MGQDVSTLFVPREVDVEDLARLIADTLPDVQHDLAALIAQPKTGPASLAREFESYGAISLWGEDPCGWDDVIAALSNEVSSPVLALSTFDRGRVACWQPFQGGLPGSARWVADRHPEVAGDAFKAVYGLALPPGEQVLIESLATRARAGCWIVFRPDLQIAQLETETVERIVAGDAGLSCCLLEHDLGLRTVGAVSVPGREIPSGPGATAKDKRLLEALMALTDLSPARRVFVDDLACTVLAGGKTLTPGQRKRAKALLEAESDKPARDFATSVSGRH